MTLDIARAYRGDGKTTYTNTDSDRPSRCRGCGSLYGNGHYQGCFQRETQTQKLPKIRVSRKGSASWHRSHGDLLKRLPEGSWNGK